MARMFKLSCLCAALLSVILAGCVENDGGVEKKPQDVTVTREGATTTVRAKDPGPENSLRIASGSENRDLEFLLEDFCAHNKGSIIISYMGSLDIMNILKQGGAGYDSVWPANSMWISLGDTSFRVKHTASVYQTPVVFGVKKSLAAELGFTGPKVSVADILAAIQAKRLSFCMTSATQSNSGACAYISFLYAFLGNPDMIRPGDLDDPALQRSVRELLMGINRSSGSSDWLKDVILLALLCVAAPSLFPALSWMYILFPFGLAAIPVVVMILEWSLKRKSPKGEQSKRPLNKAPSQEQR